MDEADVTAPDATLESDRHVVDDARPEPEAVPPKPRDDRFFGRFGTFLLTLPEDAAEDKAAYSGFFERVLKAVREDSHVTAVADTKFDPSFTREWRGFPAHQRSTTRQILSGSDHFHVFNFSSPIAFEVSVPAKNQPIIMGVEDVPTDRYWACWDGTTLLTIWRQQPDDSYPARSAGHVVESILRRAAKAAGLDLIVQACSPGCTNMYAHRTLRLDQYFTKDDESKSFSFDGEHPQMIRAHLHADDVPLDIVQGVHSRISYAFLHFARYKNASRRLINTELLARRLTDDLLTLDYASLYGAEEVTGTGVAARFSGWWRTLTRRGRGRRAKRIVIRCGSSWLASKPCSANGVTISALSTSTLIAAISIPFLISTERTTTTSWLPSQQTSFAPRSSTVQLAETTP